jgi:hypothetical protein
VERFASCTVARHWIRGVGLVLVVLVLGGGLWAKTEWTAITPEAFDREVTLQIGKTDRVYYELQKGSEVRVRVSGPTKLRVISRVEIPSSKEERQYNYFVRRDEGKWVKFTRYSGVSSQASLKNDGSTQVSISKKHILKVPAGLHTYTFRLSKKSTRRVFLRFQQLGGGFGSPTDVVAMTPEVSTESVGLVVGEQVTTYYRLAETREVVLDLIGPTKLKVLARLEFDPNMRGQQNYRVQVYEDGIIKGTYPLTAVKSDVCQYEAPCSLVPAKAETFFLDIPDGEHEYRFALPENHRTVLIKLLLPKKGLTQEP